MFDWFVAPLRCPVCGAVSPASSVTNMQTHLRDDADGSELAIGAKFDPLDIRRDDILNSGYLLVSDPVPDVAIRLLETWKCPTSGHENWALITIVGDKISEIEAVILDRATLERANFISDQCFVLAAQLSDVSGADLAAGRVSSVELLRKLLP
jgi:hypothetical protein